MEGEMKRKMIAMLMASLMMLGSTGCSTEGLNLYNEMEKTGTWDYQEMKGDLAVSIQGEGKEVNLKADFTGYTSTQENQGYADMIVTEINLGDIKLETELSPVRLYVDKQTMYISKSYFTQLFETSGAPIPEKLNEIEAEYIGFNSMEEAEQGEVDYNELNSLVRELFKGSEIKLPIIQKGRTYTIELDSHQMADLSVQFIGEIMGKMNAYDDTTLTAEEIEAQNDEMLATMDEGKEIIEPMIEGSHFKVIYDFKDNTYSQAIDMALKVTPEDESVFINVSMDSQVAKSNKREFELPKSSVVYSMEEIAGLFGETSSPELTESVAWVEQDQTITANDETYIPLRQTMKELGYDVKYDANTKRSAITAYEEEAVVVTIIQNGISYIALSELDALGFYTEENEEYIVIEDLMVFN
jgi:hypothetical protein